MISLTSIQKKFKRLTSIGQGQVVASSADRKMVKNFSKYVGTNKAQGRALVSYRSGPVIDLLYGDASDQFSNPGSVQLMVQALNELGFVVDAIDWDDVNPVVSEEYDLMILHGGKNYDAVKTHLKTNGALIYFSTGSYWKYHNKQEGMRFNNFKKRHHVGLHPDRKINDSEEVVNRAADMILCLGNQATAATYGGFSDVKNIPAASFPDKRAFPARDYSKARKHFLFMSGPGNIHKGLDWVLDVFVRHPEWHLHIMADLETDFAKYYDKALQATPNIHAYGRVDFRSQKFYEVVDQCAFSILLSCSEGSPGSVLESMEQGLIPILTQTSHCDIYDSGFMLEQLSMARLEGLLEQIEGLGVTDLVQKSKRARQIIEEHHRPDMYRETMRKLITEQLRESGRL